MAKARTKPTAPRRHSGPPSKASKPFGIRIPVGLLDDLLAVAVLERPPGRSQRDLASTTRRHVGRRSTEGVRGDRSLERGRRADRAQPRGARVVLAVVVGVIATFEVRARRDIRTMESCIVGASTMPVEWLNEDCFELALRVDSFREQFAAALKSRSESEARREAQPSGAPEIPIVPDAWSAGPPAP